MHKEFENALATIESKITELNPQEIQQAFANIPLDIFAELQLDRPPAYPNIMQWLPEMPSADVQIAWTGSANHVLMDQTLAFIKTIISTYHEISCKPISSGTVLDFGCGWGRIIRLLCKYVPVDKIYGVDPWHESIEISQQTRVPAHLLLSDYLPRTLPTPEGLKFDFIMAFSVFTHLSEKVTKICAYTLRDHLSDSGILAITIRPIEYWDFALNLENSAFSQKDIEELQDAHEQKGFAFSPHNREEIEGEITYGDTSMSLQYIKDNFIGLDIVRVEYNKADSLQLLVFLQKA
jgi:trans-aconitate methyltransferase